MRSRTARRAPLSTERDRAGPAAVARSFRECTRSLDDQRTDLALELVGYFAAPGEDQELVAVGYRVHELYPQLWDIGCAGTEAKHAARERIAQEDR